MAPTTSDANDSTTLQESTDRLEAAGFVGQFAAAEDGMVRCFACHQLSAAGDVEVVILLRTEGASDPDDMSAVAAISCPRCQTKGTLVLKYGPEASLEDSDVLRDLTDRR